ncbi:MAG: hypothetical protein JWO50_590 [Candidatus Kaiserbacteria bacterium]|nr:hypothetical protein [Candidatus Kaiserbacteria bacterium]
MYVFRIFGSRIYHVLFDVTARTVVSIIKQFILGIMLPDTLAKATFMLMRAF